MEREARHAVNFRAVTRQEDAVSCHVLTAARAVGDV